MNNCCNRMVEFVIAESLWRKDNLSSLCHTSLGSSLFYSLVLAVIEHRSLRLKDLYGECDHADSAIRKNLNHLQRDGWIELHRSLIDPRAKEVVPCQKAIELANKYIDDLYPILFEESHRPPKPNKGSAQDQSTR